MNAFLQYQQYRYIEVMRTTELVVHIPAMKIHESLNLKAVDIHIQKMASLTLNVVHYAVRVGFTLVMYIQYATM